MKKIVDFKPFLIILSGLPASGKSTLALKLKTSIEELTNLKVRIIDPDKIRKKISPRFNYKLEKEVRKKNLEHIEESLKLGFVTVSDDLNYYASMRHQLKEIAEKNGLKYFILHISTPFHKCIKRNESRGKPVPNEVIYRIEKKFDYFDDYSWDTPFFEIDTSKGEDIDKKVIKLLYSLEKASITPKNEVLEDNFAQNLDKLTRQLISKYLMQEKFQKDKNKILKLRKQYIKKLIKKDTNITDIKQDFIKYLESNIL